MADFNGLENFHVARYNGVIAVVTKLERENMEFRKALDLKTSQYNALKIQHLEWLQEAADDRIKRAQQFIVLKEKIKFLES